MASIFLIDTSGEIGTRQKHGMLEQCPSPSPSPFPASIFPRSKVLQRTIRREISCVAVSITINRRYSAVNCAHSNLLNMNPHPQLISLIPTQIPRATRNGTFAFSVCHRTGALFRRVLADLIIQRNARHRKGVEPSSL